ncbi:hypothetical protein [Yoonia sp. BS5-3]|uniref:Tetratricopeptide repeat protein n=1 Tax=Yoonia phaeophyticola TaxID=3137369 RepID=A0ABZ2V532_9RHOB
MLGVVGVRSSPSSPLPIQADSAKILKIAIGVFIRFLQAPRTMASGTKTGAKSKKSIYRSKSDYPPTSSVFACGEGFQVVGACRDWKCSYPSGHGKNRSDMTMRRWFSGVAIMVFLGFFAEPGSAQQENPLPTIETLMTWQRQAEDALVNDDPERTIVLTDQILAARPNSFAALFLQALALSDLERYRQSARVAGEAYKVGSDEQGLLQSARLAGNAHFRAAQYARAEIWLRRATNHLQSEQDAEQVVRLFQRAREANPLSMSYNFTLSPTDNVNGGSDNDELCFENLDGTCAATLILSENDIALPGASYSGLARLSYRLSETDTQITTLRALVFGRSVILSREAKDTLASSPVEIVQDLKASDFSSFLTEFALEQRQAQLSPLGPTQFSIHLGEFWQAGVPVVRYRDFKVGQLIPIGTDDLLSFTAVSRLQDGVVPGILAAEINDFSVSYSKSFSNDDLLQWTVFHRDNIAGPETSFLEYSTSVDYAFGNLFLDAQWSASAELGIRTFDEFTTTFDGRRDVFGSVNVSALLREYSYFGFSPSISLSAAKTDSDVDFVDSTTIQLSFGIGSNL